MKAEKAPPKRKVPKIGELKKTLIISGIIAAIAIAGIIVGINIYSMTTQKPDVVLVVGTYGSPSNIDPLAASFQSDIDIIQQVAEGLFEIDVKSNNSEIIYNLAINHLWSVDALNLTCTLRQGVKFHDGTPFNANAVKWNFDRNYRFRNDTAYPELWRLPDGKFIINQTQVLGEYAIRFVLNAPYVPLVSLLTSYTSFILSPTSTPEDDFIEVLTGDLIGTGPFIYDTLAWDDNVSMSANPYYWGGKPKIDKLIFKRIETFIPIHFPMRNSLLSGEIHLAKQPYFNESTINEFRSDSSFTVQDGISTPTQHCFVMNNILINITMRKAISYAFNYSSLIEVNAALWERAISPIPEGVLYHNTTGIHIPDCNISKARQTLKDANWNGTAGLTANDNITAGNEWETIANSPTPLATYNYSMPIEWGGGYIIMLNHLTEDLKQIGVKIVRVNITYAQWDYQVSELEGYHRNMFHFTVLGWFADFNDPSNCINVLFTNKRLGFNFGQVNDTEVQQLMDDALAEIDPNARRQLYYEIQKHLIEEVYPHTWIISWRRTDVYVSNLRGWYPNTFKDLYKFVYFV